MNNLLEIV